MIKPLGNQRDFTLANSPGVASACEAIVDEPMEVTFGDIDLGDIKAPQCFEIEERLRGQMDIPVFHDDQHGTAIIVCAGVLNAMEITGKKLEDIKLVTSGAGAAALASLNLLISFGVKRGNIWVTDIDGLVHEGREDLDQWLAAFAQTRDKRTLAEAIEGADVFLGLSAGSALTSARVFPSPIRRMIHAKMTMPPLTLSAPAARGSRPIRPGHRCAPARQSLLP